MLLGITILFCRQAVYPYFQQAWMSRDWPATRGFITQSEVDKQGNEHRLLFTYRYEVAGVLYHNSGRYMNEGETPQRVRGGLYSFAETHPAGDSITIYYNPQAPRQATTFTGSNWLHWIMLGLGVFFTYFTALLLFFPQKVNFRKY